AAERDLKRAELAGEVLRVVGLDYRVGGLGGAVGLLGGLLPGLELRQAGVQHERPDGQADGQLVRAGSVTHRSPVTFGWIGRPDHSRGAPATPGTRSSLGIPCCTARGAGPGGRVAPRGPELSPPPARRPRGVPRPAPSAGSYPRTGEAV